MGFFLPVPPAAGGATEKSWHRLAREFARAGHAVTLVSRRWPGWADDETSDGVRYLRLRGADHTPRLARNLWRDFRWSLRVWAALPAADVTIVHAVALPVLLGWLRRRAGRLVVTPGRMPKGQFRLYRRLDRVLAVSTPVRAALLAENPRLAPLTRLSGYPISWALLSAPRPPRVPAPPVTLGFIGRLHREKGLDLLVAALRTLARDSTLPPWRIELRGPADIARGGSGEAYAASLHAALAEFLPAENFALLPPAFDEAQLAAAYRGLDIFCYPSLAAQGETFGVAVAEAMAAGAAPVVSALPCFLDFVRPGDNGLVFDHTSPDATSALAAALARFVGDAALRTRLATAACADVQRYDHPVFARRLLDDFETLATT